MIRRTFCLACAFVLLLVPSSALAVSEYGAQGITAEVVDGVLTVNWSAADGEVAFYNVYYKSDSILQSGGGFDDFEHTDGSETSFAFPSLPVGKEVYISVLPVDLDGNEAEIFLEEFRVELPQVTPPTPEEPVEEEVMEESTEEEIELVEEVVEEPIEEISEGVVEEPVEEEAGPLYVESLNVISPTEISVVFSDPIYITEEGAPQAFAINGAGAKDLQIVRLIVENNIATIVTDMQERGAAYELRLSEPLQSRAGQELERTSQSTLFRAHPDSKGKTMRDAPADVTGYSLASEPDGKRGYRIFAKWNADPYASAYMVRQSADGGLTFGEPMPVPPEAEGITIEDVSPGVFGIVVHTMNKGGDASPGVLQLIDVESGVVVGNTPLAPPRKKNGDKPKKKKQKNFPPPGAKTVPRNFVPAKPNPNSGLPGTGAAIPALLVAIAGGAVGRTFTLRKKR